jgi:metallo-beta-lactamase class B
MVDVGSLWPPDYQLIGNAKYPDIVADFESSFAANPPCDIALARHPDMVFFWQRVDKRDRGDVDALMDSRGCRSYIEDAHESFEAELARQRAGAVPVNRR